MISELFAPSKEARSLENPQTSLANYDESLMEALGGDVLRSGMVVNHKTAQKLSAVWAARRILSEDVARLPLHCFRREGDSRVVVTEGPLADFARRPDRNRTRMQFIEWLMTCTLMRGNFWADTPRSTGQVRHMTPIDPSRVTAFVDQERTRILGIGVQGREEPLRPDQFFHVPGQPDEANNGLLGLSVISKAAQSIGLSLAIQDHSEDFFVNGARVSVVLETDQKLKPDTVSRLKQQWVALYAGRGSGHKTALLEEGLKAKTLSANDAKRLEHMAAGIEEVARWFRMPTYKLAQMSDAKYANVEQMALDYVIGSVSPYTVRIEESFNDAVLTSEERGRGLLLPFQRRAPAAGRHQDTRRSPQDPR